jgi:multimeric flavodoxin WrbA
MYSAFVVNGSPRLDRGNTGQVLAPFLEGMEAAGAKIELVYASRLKAKPCACGRMACWYEQPGECCIQDRLTPLYPHLRAAETLVLATPIYIPLPGDMQNIINRLVPLLDPCLRFEEGRTRARTRADVSLRRVVVVATSGWWEKENLELVVHIGRELALNGNMEFAGSVLRPHAFLMRHEGKLTDEGQDVVAAARQAGIELVRDGAMREETLDAVSRPLIAEEELRHMYNK